MIKCPHCGGVVFQEPPGFEKLSRQQAAIYMMFAENPKRYLSIRDIAKRLYANRPGVAGINAKSIICVQIFRIREKMGNVIDTTPFGYRLLSSDDNANTDKSTTESETK